MPKVAINGFGRIGKAVFRRIFENHPELNVVAINDLTEPSIIAHLLKYDTVYGTYQREVKVSTGAISVDGKEIKILSERNPEKLPWREMNVDVVIECTGEFTNYEELFSHIKAGAQKVILSASSKNPDKIPSYVLGVNADNFDPKKDQIIDMASCTTNCLAPILFILEKKFGVKKGFMTTVHSYTNDQRILDVAHSDLRRARAAALNIIPTTTGAARSIGRVIPELNGKIDGIALRVPTPTVSVLDLFCELKKETTKEELNNLFKKESEGKDLLQIIKIEDSPLVSSDYIGNSFSAIIDSNLTMVNENIVKIVAWYDNEWGYSCRLADFTNIVAKNL